MIKIDVHPAAAIFPMQSDAELAEMAKSITAFGLREKIGTILSDDPNTILVLDGRNRLEALRRIGVKDEVIINEFTIPVDLQAMSATPEEYVLMANIERRNLGATQRRNLAGKLAVMLAERQKHLPKEQQVDTLSVAAQKAGVSRRTAATAKQEVLEMAASHSEGEAVGPTKKKAKAPKKSALIKPSKMLEYLNTFIGDTQSYGHNFAPKEVSELRAKVTVLGELLDSKMQSIAEKAQKEAEEAAAEAKRIADEHNARAGK